MKRIKSIFTGLFFLISLSFIVAVSVSAQPPGGNTGSDQSGGQMGGVGQEGAMGQQGGPGGQMGGMQMDAEQMQQMMAERYKELLGMGDDEWAVIGPYVLKVSELSQSSQSGSSGMRMMMRGNMTGGPQSQGQDQQQSGKSDDQASNQNQRGNRGNMMGQQAGNENLEALQTLLEDENATSDEIKSKLATLRKSRETAKRELAAAQKELRELLTLRQEAMLVVMGLLE